MTCGSKVAPSNVQPDSKASIQIWFWPLNSAPKMPRLTNIKSCHPGRHPVTPSLKLGPTLHQGLHMSWNWKGSSVICYDDFWCKKTCLGTFGILLSIIHPFPLQFDDIYLCIALDSLRPFSLPAIHPYRVAASCECVATRCWQFCMKAHGMTWIS